MITDQLKTLTEAVAKSFPRSAVAIFFESWVHMSENRELGIRLMLSPGVNGEHLDHIHFRNEAELTDWIASGCKTSVVYLDADGIHLRVPELQVLNTKKGRTMTTWIETKDRVPTAADADEDGHVKAWDGLRWVWRSWDVLAAAKYPAWIPMPPYTPPQPAYRPFAGPDESAATIDGVVPPRRWEEMPRDEQKGHYWAAIPDDSDTILDGWDYEIVYVYFDGKWCVMRPGESQREPLSTFRFICPVDKSA